MAQKFCNRTEFLPIAAAAATSSGLDSGKESLAPPLERKDFALCLRTFGTARRETMTFPSAADQ